MALLRAPWLRRAGIALTCWMVGGIFGGTAHGQAFSEYQLKAIFVLRFAQFVEWPTTAAPTSSFGICIIGDDPFGAYLEEAVRGESVGNRPVALRRYRRSADAVDCRIAFVSDSEQAHFEQTSTELRERGVLTVGDSREFAERGGMIELVTADNRIRLEINLDSARSANLQISSKLLRPATIVRTRG